MKTIVILNHALTADQKAELKSSTIVELSPELRSLWANIPANGDSQAVRDHLAPIFMEIQQVDQVVCQGEASAFGQVLRLCDAWDIPVLVACTERVSEEVTNPDGSVTKKNLFKHVQFRRV